MTVRRVFVREFVRVRICTHGGWLTMEGACKHGTLQVCDERWSHRKVRTCTHGRWLMG